jgi:hypothetical protein
MRPYPAQGSGLPHIIRDDRHCYIAYRPSAVGGPIAIARPSGKWQLWDQAPNAFHPFPTRLINEYDYDAKHGQRDGQQLTLAAAIDPPPLRVTRSR